MFGLSDGCGSAGDVIDLVERELACGKRLSHPNSSQTSDRELRCLTDSEVELVSD
jgi:hypothetical protein